MPKTALAMLNTLGRDIMVGIKVPIAAEIGMPTNLCTAVRNNGIVVQVESIVVNMIDRDVLVADMMSAEGPGEVSHEKGQRDKDIVASLPASIIIIFPIHTDLVSSPMPVPARLTICAFRT